MITIDLRWPMGIGFLKGHSLGNDFALVSQEVSLSSEQIRSLADRKKGIGFDQLILMSRCSESNPFRLQFYNADGSKAEACGNGTRFAAYFLFLQDGLDHVTFQIGQHSVPCVVSSEGQIIVDMGKPSFDHDVANISANNENLKLNKLVTDFPLNELLHNDIFYVNVGNPHIVIFVKESCHLFAKNYGPLIENSFFFPNRINVNFASIRNDQHIDLAVWERGAGLTNACGTGACATFAAARKAGLVHNKGPITVSQDGGDLSLQYSPNQTILMEGNATITYRGWLNGD